MKTRLFLFLQKILPQHFLSRLSGKLANWRAPKWILQPGLRWFVEKYAVDMQQAAESDLNDYKTFNEFFTRRLKTDARPIATGIISPADGTISAIGAIKSEQVLQAKNHYYTLQTLLAGDADLASQFTNGNFATIYLSPKDYHRVHMPYGGKLLQSIYVPGTLFSVNPTTVDNIPDVFARNERLINIFETDKGPMAVILVGAMLVAGIHTAWQGKITPNCFHQVQQWNYEQQNIELQKGDEVGFFNFGSTVIVLFAEDKINWQSQLQSKSTIKMGENLGE